MKWKKLFINAIKVLSILGSLVFIAHRIWYESSKGVLGEALVHLSPHWAIILAVVFFFMGLNWYLESKKWQMLLRNIHPLNRIQSVKSVFSGITVSIFTPNRVGEFVGRVVLFPEHIRGAATIANLFGNLIQLLITLMMGLVTFPFFIAKAPKVILEHPNLIYFLTIGFLIFGFVFVISIKRIILKLSHVKWFTLLNKYLIFLSLYRKEQLIRIIILSIIRYLVFGFQFFILIRMFEVPISFFDTITGICQFYFLMALLPTFAFLELGVRGSVSILVFSIFTPNTLGVMAASVVLWFINLAVPSFAGAFILAQKRF